jgi:hypothetical protein
MVNIDPKPVVARISKNILSYFYACLSSEQSGVIDRIQKPTIAKALKQQVFPSTLALSDN